ncbi:MAG TPA: AAA family ATPase [Acidimicrobiales bacterium]|nr:AAA family ATPase [Acidimicrobiales bacterium]
MPKVYAVANQKGGVAKTTTVHSLGTALAERGRQVLLVDLDPQACLTYSLGLVAAELGHSLHDVIVHRTPAADALTKVGDIHILPATIDLTGAEIYLLSKTGREYALARAIEPVVSGYDVVLIDCPPSLGILTINGLTAAHEVLIPLQCETLSSRGVGQLLETVGDVRSFTNPGLGVAGVIATMYDGRTRLGQQVLADAHEQHGLELLPPPVPKSVKVAEAPGRSRSVLQHAPHSPAADAYRELAAHLDSRIR